ncbi:hypothetical protein HID58_048795 [Brassica napus]|uniref:Transmembrane protein n=1 Tax=Brassica napus TaxID=3708 RepID=A0ABQ8B405_BRANA|nr:hypothetical protein HID58_048795 [Brassica napus]
MMKRLAKEIRETYKRQREQRARRIIYNSASHHHRKKTHLCAIELHLLGLGQSLIVFDVAFLVALFHNLRTVPRFANFVSSLILYLFFHLGAPFIAARVSGGSPFWRVFRSTFGQFFPLCMLYGLGRFLVPSLRSGFSLVGFHSLSLRLFLFFPASVGVGVES